MTLTANLLRAITLPMKLVAITAIAAGCKGRYDESMSIVLSKTYEALIAAGAPEDKARAAAEEIAGYENRLVRLEVMVTLILAGVTSLVVKAFFA